MSWFATNSYYKTSAWPDRAVQLAPKTVRNYLERELRRRRYDALDDSLVRRHFALEPLERWLGTRNVDVAEALTSLRHRVFPFRLIRLLRREPVDVLWGPYDCLEAFEWAKPKGITCILDQPIVHFNSLDEILRAEQRRHPDYFISALHKVRSTQLRRQQRAAEIADVIVVGSPYAAQSMIDHGAPRAKLAVIPYGFDETAYRDDLPNRPSLRGRPLEVLFVGSAGPRKGIAHLLEAFQHIAPEQACLTIVGPLDMPAQRLAGRGPHVRYLGQVRRDAVAAHMRAADCLILPSLAEGGGIVLYEATAAGLPLIHSDRCGDGVREGRNGIILPEVSADAIRRAVLSMAGDPKLWEQMRLAAWSMRHERTWTCYRNQAVALVNDCVGPLRDRLDEAMTPQQELLW